MEKKNKNLQQNNEERKNKKRANKTYVSLLPTLLIGAAVMSPPVIAVCAILGSLVVIAAVVLAIMAVKKKKAKAQTQEEAKPEPVADEAPQEETPQAQEEPAAEQAEEAVAEQVNESYEEEQVEEAAAEVVEEEPAAAVTPQSEPEEPAEEGNVADLTEFTETGEASGRAYDARRHMFVLVRYDRSYTSRIIQSDDKTKSYYDEIKGELMSYKGVKSRISWKHENFRIGRERVAKLQFRGKKLCLYLPLDPNDYIDSKYKIEDFSDVAKNKEVPLAYLIKNDLRARYAKELIAAVMARFGAEKLEGETATYSQDYPYDSLESLIDRELIKVLMTDEEYEEAASDIAEEVAEPIKPSELVHEVKPETAHRLISDERAEHLIVESTRYADPTRKGFVNVDVLSRNFEAGEFVTLDEMKKRVKGFDKRMTFVKVLARGILDKPLTVEGDDFSIDAAKMILLTGGKVIRTKRK